VDDNGDDNEDGDDPVGRAPDKFDSVIEALLKLVTRLGLLDEILKFRFETDNLIIFPNFPNHSFFFNNSSSANDDGKPTTYTKLRCKTRTELRGLEEEEDVLEDDNDEEDGFVPLSLEISFPLLLLLLALPMPILIPGITATADLSLSLSFSFSFSFFLLVASWEAANKEASDRGKLEES